MFLSLVESSESWVIDSGASFHATFQQDIFQNYVKSVLRKVYLGDDEPCNIVGKGDVVVSPSNGSTLKLRNVRHAPKLKRNLISIGQLADGGMKTTFDGNVCKITKGAMVMAHRKKEGTLYMTSGSVASISIASLEADVRVGHQRLGHMSEK